MKHYKKYNELFINDDIILEGKLWNWIWIAPKIKRLQQKANDERMMAVREAAKQREQIEQAIKTGRNINIDKLQSALERKLEARENMAVEYEQEAEELAAGNPYLMKVKRTIRLKGVVELNRLKISSANAEEAKELKQEAQEANRESVKLSQEVKQAYTDAVKIQKTGEEPKNLDLEYQKELQKYYQEVNKSKVDLGSVQNKYEMKKMKDARKKRLMDREKRLNMEEQKRQQRLYQSEY